ncbi:MAG: 2-amino-4-hydroxy-6-hydroxymethyldihydropteridine diphosphokinase [Bacteroidales bacterium]|nr:2-amino-4-hydroxy-6-hydroxymethyldihydropteridine diphosphokinase [Bacteroidales bacterium]MBN2820637.1 2-amino-4-hydroxy-6-hydroxymethyldihydropteridine diphosphokinase [Bacteroidales bacterium]
MINSTYIILGSNKGDRYKNIYKAKLLINSVIGTIETASSLYESEAWGYEDDMPFLNKIIKVKTSLNPEKVLEKCVIIEDSLGRVRTKNSYEARTIDIDILLFNDDIINTPDLVIPHPRMHLRNFVLIPLSEICSEHLHPIMKKTIDQLLTECSDKSWVKKDPSIIKAEGPEL